VGNNIYRLALNYLLGFQRGLKQSVFRKHQKPVIVWGRLRGEYLPNLQLVSTNEYEIGVAVYQGDIVTFRHKASGIHCWEVNKLQFSGSCHMNNQALSKLCQAFCYTGKELKKLYCTSCSLPSCQQMLDSQSLDGIKPPIPDYHNIEPYSIESLNEEEASNAGFPLLQELPLRQNQEPRPHLQPHLPN